MRTAPTALALVATLALGVPSVGHAADKTDPSGKLQEVERAIDAGRRKAERLKREAEALTEELARLRRASIVTAKTVQAHEAEIGRLETRLQELAAVERDTAARLKERRRQFMYALVAVQRIARHPPEALLAQPLSPTETVRSAILLRAAVPEIERRTARIRDDLETVSAARRTAIQHRDELAAAAEGLTLERAKLRSLLAEKAALRQEVATASKAEERRVKKLAREAKSLKELLGKLQAAAKARRAEEEKKAKRRRTKSAATATPTPAGAGQDADVAPRELVRGTILVPVVGTIVERYGKRLGGGLTAKGLRLETRPGAQVIATQDGRVVFAGRFRGYGQLLIIQHGGGYHSLLAGMDRIDGVMGQRVLAGEPVGTMGQPAAGKPDLYFELRRKGQPINPLPWLAARDDKVRG